MLASPSGLPFRFSVGIEKQSDGDPDPMGGPACSRSISTAFTGPGRRSSATRMAPKGKTERPSRWTRPSRCPWTAPTRMDSRAGWSFKSGRRTAILGSGGGLHHYLSPDHKVDFDVLAMKPPPWELVKGQDGDCSTSRKPGGGPSRRARTLRCWASFRYPRRSACRHGLMTRSKNASRTPLNPSPSPLCHPGDTPESQRRVGTDNRLRAQGQP